jgi:hypothetical protein
MRIVFRYGQVLYGRVLVSSYQPRNVASIGDIKTPAYPWVAVNYLLLTILTPPRVYPRFVAVPAPPQLRRHVV